jgi:hypothetical protein
MTENGTKPMVDKVFGFTEVQAAYKYMASGARFREIVIRSRSSSSILARI